MPNEVLSAMRVPGPVEMFLDIRDFHRKFGLDSPASPQLLEGELLQFRVGFMAEELKEYVDASVSGNLTKAADALADLAYVVLGTAYLMGLPFDQIWQLVHAANMKKIRAPSAAHSKRGSAFDVVKPEGWVSPDPAIEELLTATGALRANSNET